MVQFSQVTISYHLSTNIMHLETYHISLSPKKEEKHTIYVHIQ
jgi:hypothetical protein